MAKKPAALTALKQLANEPLTTATFEAMLEGLRSESDRAAVVIAGSLIDDELATALEKKMRPLARDDRQQLFGFDGPVGTFSSRILLAYALQIIDADDRAKLTIIREMRNACAHSRVALTFATPELRDAAVLLLPQNIRNTTDPKKLRALFLMIIGLLMIAISEGKSDATRDEVHELLEKKVKEIKSRSVAED